MPEVLPIGYSIQAEVFRTSTGTPTVIKTLTILADPAAYDGNGDGQNNVADIGFSGANWPNQSLIHDFDGNGAFNVRDLLFIRTSN